MGKWEFIRSELISRSIQGAFQRASVYSSSTSNESQHEELRKRLTLLLLELEPQYLNSVSEEQHKKNIVKIANTLSSDFNDILRNGRFRLGIAQKALNLFLKYLWCLERVACPPHCPFDFKIIDKLRARLSGQKKHLQWTTLDCLEDYQVLVDAGLEEIKGKYSSLSEWELQVWGDQDSE